jgi:hypothetical protein
MSEDVSGEVEDAPNLTEVAYGPVVGIHEQPPSTHVSAAKRTVLENCQLGIKCDPATSAMVIAMPTHKQSIRGSLWQIGFQCAKNATHSEASSRRKIVLFQLVV